MNKLTILLQKQYIDALRKLRETVSHFAIPRSVSASRSVTSFGLRPFLRGSKLDIHSVNSKTRKAESCAVGAVFILRHSCEITI